METVTNTPTHWVRRGGGLISGVPTISSMGAKWWFCKKVLLTLLMFIWACGIHLYCRYWMIRAHLLLTCFAQRKRSQVNYLALIGGALNPLTKTNKPKSDCDCPELLPLSLKPRSACDSALDNPNGKVHPISRSTIRKVLGTRLSESHKIQNECAFHNINLCRQAPYIKAPSNIYSNGK